MKYCLMREWGNECLCMSLCFMQNVKIFCATLCVYIILSLPPYLLPSLQCLLNCTISTAKIHWWIVYVQIFIRVSNWIDRIVVCLCDYATLNESVCVYKVSLYLCVSKCVIARVEINSHKQIKWHQQNSQTAKVFVIFVFVWIFRWNMTNSAE